MNLFEGMTVAEAVAHELLNPYRKVRRGERWFRTSDISRAHPEHPYSGLQRLREFRVEYGLNYNYDRKANVYVVKASDKKLRQIFRAERAKRGRK